MEPKESWLIIKCPNCSKQFADDAPVLEDGADYTCPNCDSEITITMTWESPEPEKAA